jgi:hypothetical protein
MSSVGHRVLLNFLEIFMVGVIIFIGGYGAVLSITKVLRIGGE